MNNKSVFSLHKAGIYQNTILCYRIRDEFRDGLSRDILFFHKTKGKRIMMQGKLKYAWDICVERNFTEKQLETINQISSMMSSGCDIKVLGKKFKQLNI